MVGGNYFQRQYERWSAQYQASEIDKITEMDHLISWLSDNIPADDGKVSLVHGDYRLDNLIFSADNSRVIAVLIGVIHVGASLCGSGLPMYGICLPARDSPGISSSLAVLIEVLLAYPPREDYVTQYCQRMGIDKINNWPLFIWPLVFFRVAAICQGLPTCR